jgi:hypothetical protein
MAEENSAATEEKPKKAAKVQQELPAEPAVVPPARMEPKFTAPTKQELDEAGAVNITQFLRGEILSMKDGFGYYVKNKGIGGRKTRQEWLRLFQEFKQTPAIPFKKREG